MMRKVNSTDRLCKVIVILSETDKPMRNVDVYRELAIRYDVEVTQGTTLRDLQTLADHELVKRPSSTSKGWAINIAKELK